MSLSRLGNEVIQFNLERFTGRYYRGRPMYRMTIALGALPNDGQSSVAHTIQGLDEVHHLFGTAENPDGEWIAIPT